MRSVLVLLTVLAVAAPASGARVFLNGVPVDGVTDQEFTSVRKVRIDAAGDVHIDAPDYVIERQEDAPRAPLPQPGASGLAKRYWLVTTAVARDVTVEIVLDGALLRRIEAGDGPVAEEITPRLRAGVNRIKVKTRRAGPSSEPLSVVIGEARIAADERVLLDGAQVGCQATPGEERELTLTAR